jgi:hypothetical protein
MPSCELGSPNCHFTCPFGGAWHVCRDPPYFVGCCSSDPCTNATESACPPENLYSSIFDGDVYDKILPGSCIGDSPNNFFTCNYTFPPFTGCCRTNPCTQMVGCPLGDVLPAAWKPDSVYSMYDIFLDKDATVIETIPSGGTSPSNLSPSDIVGIALGGVAVLVVVVLAVVVAFRRRRRHAVIAAGEEEHPFLGHYAEYVLSPSGKS